MKNHKNNDAKFVLHPRYGSQPHLTGLNPIPEPNNGVRLHPHSSKKHRIPYTAIAAIEYRQNVGLGHVTHYFDTVQQCRQCQRNFIFFAKEQQHWYEVLGFHLSVKCRYCVLCRKLRRQLAKTRRRYDRLLGLSVRTEAETLELVDDGLTLIEQSIFGDRVIERVKQLLNQIPADSKTRRLARFRDLLERSKRLS